MNQNEVKRRKIQCFADIIALITVLIVSGKTGEEGVAYLAAALMAFAFLWTLICGSTADTLGMLLRSRGVKGQYRNAAKMRQSIMIFQLALGLLGGCILFLSAGFIGRNLFRVQYSVFLIMLFAPIMLLRSVSEALMGFCLGEGADFAVGVACMLRQIFVLVFSLIFCSGLGNYGDKVGKLLAQENFAAMYTAAGAVIAVNVSELFVILFLLVIHKINGRANRARQPEGMRSVDSFPGTVRSFTVNRAPRFALNLLLLFPVIAGFLLYGGNVTDQEAGFRDYGAYFGIYLPYSLICIFVAVSVFLPICSRTVISLRKEEQRAARTVYQSGIHITVVNSLFFAVFLAVTASQAAGVWGDGNVAENLLRFGSLVIPCAALTAYFSRFLMLTGKKFLVLGTFLISDLLYVLSLLLFLKVWGAGILALVYAMIISWALACILMGVITARQLRTGSLWVQNYIIPVGAACVSGLLCLLLCRLVSPRLGDIAALLVCAAVSFVVYWAILLLARNFREQELDYIPGGRWIAFLGQLLHVL